MRGREVAERKRKRFEQRQRAGPSSRRRAHEVRGDVVGEGAAAEETPLAHQNLDERLRRARACARREWRGSV
eukprot:1797098-Pleurochrysis_carterae.AAC.2